MNKHVFPAFLLSIALVSFFASCSSINKNKAVTDGKAAMGVEDPNRANLFYNQGVAWDIKGNFDQAVICYAKAIEINPRHARAHNSLAWLMATGPDGRYRNGAKSIECAESAVNLSREADFLNTLAASYAEAGHFEDAIKTQKSAINSLTEESKAEKLTEYKAHLICFRAYRPWRKTYCIDAFKESAVEAETAVSQQVSEEKAPELKQDVHPACRKEPAKKIRPSIFQQTGDGNSPTTCKGNYPYTIHVSSYQDRKKSNHMAAELKEQGAPAFTCPVHLPGKGDWNRVFIGYYQTLEETRKAASKLKGKQYLHPTVTKMPYAVQVGIFDSDHELKKREVDLRSKAYLTYGIPDRKDDNKTRLLIGAYKAEKDAAGLARKLQGEGFNPKVVQR